MKRNYSVNRILKHTTLFLLPLLIVLVVRLIGSTLRYRFINIEAYHRAKSDGNVIAVFWHQKFFPILYSHRNRKINILVSHHRDGEIIARTLKLMGFTVTRGSTTRGGTRACRLMTKVVKNRDLAITPDGPKGPRYHFSGGAITIAKHSSRPVLPIGVGAQFAKYFASWDRFMIPLPTSRITVLFGNVHYIKREADDKAIREELEKELKEINSIAERF